MLPVIGILYGDAAGIGPEIIARFCADNLFSGICRPILIGDIRVIEQGLGIINRECRFNIIKSIEAANFGADIDFLDLEDISPEEYSLGEVNIRCGEAAYTDMKCAMDLLKQGKITGLVYAPQNKASFNLAGHELDSMDFMCRYLGVEKYGEINVLDTVCTTRVTSHIPLREVADAISTEKIVEALKFTSGSLKAIGRGNGRIAVAGLNPHNGESGLCGKEEIEVIAPAVTEACRLGINAAGPFSPDTIFVRAFRGEFDAVVTMYHDQGQIAMKLMDFTKIVTVIGGPQYPIATPAHGTAFDIAGKGIANIGATWNALKIVAAGAK